MRKYGVNYSDDVYNFIMSNAASHTIKELVQLIEEKFNVRIEKKKLAQYCIKMGIPYKYEKPAKAHSNMPTAIGTLVNKTDGNMIKIKTGNKKWEYLQRKIYEEHYGVKLPDDVYVIFLNQNKRDFRIKNLKAIKRSTSAVMSKNCLFSNDSNVTKLAILTARLSAKIAEKNGC